jgi:dienelactone hydrolase
MLFTLLSASLITLAAHTDPIADLREWVAKPERPSLGSQPFAESHLSRDQAAAALDILWEARAADLRRERLKEWTDKSITLGDKTMKFDFKVFGERPPSGRSLFLSMHGGGGAPKSVNDQQWQNQIRLYTPSEGVYLAPRAPTDTWNLWHEHHIDDFFDRIIENAIVFEGVDPHRVYLMGYSAGGDGVYQLAPRTADRYAAAAMMAGHPNDAAPDNLRNLPFAIHMGANDAAYNRNTVAEEWGKKLSALQKADPDPKTAYPHVCVLHKGKGHWMDREDAAAVPWMQTFTRNPLPTRVVWEQSGRTHARFYWISIEPADAKQGLRVVASREGHTITLSRSSPVPITLRLDDRLLDLDKPVRVVMDSKTVFEDTAPRTIRTLYDSLAERADPTSACAARITVRS